MKAKKHLATVMAATMVAGSVVPVMAETTNEALIGKNRIETAVKISKDGWNSAETVILVNDGAIADALTATPLAFAKNAPILLTSKNGLSAQVKAEIKRLGAKNAILIGGNTVLPASIEKELKELGLKPDRIKGDTREETALAIAKRLDAISDVSEIAVVNGTKGLADAVSVAAAAAERHMPILLANPKKGLSASEKFIKDEAIKASYLIGGTTVLPNKMVSSLPGKKRLEGSNRNDTNAKVIETFYKGKELKNVYVAKDGRGGDSQLIDALAVGVLAAKNASPVLIASKNLNAKQVNVINTKEVSNIVQVGGKGNEGAFNQLKEIEKEDVYEVETVEELKEALAKANANDKIVLKPNATITEDIIINTDKNVDIKVEGTVTGKVEITAPNGNVANNSTSKPETNKPSGGGSTGGTVVSPSVSSVKATISGNDMDVEATVSNAGTNKAKVEVIKEGKVEVTKSDVAIVYGKINCKIENLEKGKYTVKVTVGGSSKVSSEVEVKSKLYKVATETELSNALDKVSSGDTILLTADSYKLSNQIKLTGEQNGIILRGNGNTVITDDGNWDSKKGDKSIASIINIVKANNIVVEGIEFSGAPKIEKVATGHGINIVESTKITLNNVTSNNNAGSGVTINDSTVTINGIDTEGNKWQGINIDQTDSNESSLIINGSVNLKETLQVASDKGNPTVDWTGSRKYNLAGTTKKVWTNRDLTSGAVIVNEGVSTYYTSVKDAIENAPSNTTVEVYGSNTMNNVSINNENITIKGIGKGAELKHNTKDSTATNFITFNKAGKIENLIISGAAKNKSGLHIYCTEMILNNVTVKDCPGAGINVNGSTLTGDKITTSGNGWGGINVDPGEGVNGESKVIITGFKSYENHPIYCETNKPENDKVSVLAKDENGKEYVAENFEDKNVTKTHWVLK